MSDLGALLKAARGRNGLAQRDVADRLGVTQQQVSDWESGRSRPRAGRLQLVAETYGLSVETLADAGDYEVVRIVVSPDAAPPASISGLNVKIDDLTPAEQARVEAFVDGILSSRTQ